MNLEQGTPTNDFRSKKILNQKSLILVRYSIKDFKSLLKNVLLEYSIAISKYTCEKQV